MKRNRTRPIRLEVTRRTSRPRVHIDELRHVRVNLTAGDAAKLARIRTY